MNHFNNKEYDDLTKYFSDDVVVEYFDNFVLEKQELKVLHGKDAFVKNYMGLHSKVREFLALGFCVSDDEHLIVELYTEFHALEDTEFTAGMMKKGDAFCVTNWVCYNFSPDGKFNRIRIAHFVVHNDPPRFDPKT
jgi:hypothetical protein